VRPRYREGYRAEIVPLVCETYLSARDAGVITLPGQMKVVKACDIIMRSLAKLGIVALVDEATGYQDVRDRVALQKLLEKYVTDEWSKWTRRFLLRIFEDCTRRKIVANPAARMNLMLAATRQNNYHADSECLF
jgi:hypothetical protein